MQTSILPLCGSWTALLAHLILLVPGHAAVQDTSDSVLRWSHSATTISPWIPRSIAFAAGDNLVWASANHGSPHLVALSAGGASGNTPLLWDPSVASSFPLLQVTAGTLAADALFGIAQYPVTDAWHRRTEVSGYSVVGEVLGAPFAPRWTHDMGVIANGAGLIDCDAAGRQVVAAVWDNATQKTRIDWLSGFDGSLVRRVEFNSASLDRLAISSDGRRTVVSAGHGLHVFDAVGGEVFFQPLLLASRALSISGDGTLLLCGESQRLTVLKEVNGSFTQILTVQGAASEVATCAAISEDGRTYAVAWWDAATGTSLRLEIFDGATHQRLYELVQQGAPGGFQNLPEELVVTPDGERVAMGAWGDGSAAPEVLVYDRGLGATVLELDLPGSVQALAFDRSGTRLAVGMKSTHANQVSSLGEIRFYDTGERDLEVIGQPTISGSLDLAFEEPTAETAVFLVGTGLVNPVALPGVSGELALERQRRLLSFPSLVDSQGAAQLHLELPADLSLLGLGLSAQVIYRKNDSSLALSKSVQILIL